MKGVTKDVATALLDGGLSEGMVESDFGPCIVSKTLYRGSSVFTLYFIAVNEKWAVVDGVLRGVKVDGPIYLPQSPLSTSPVLSQPPVPLPSIPPKIVTGPMQQEDEEYLQLLYQIEQQQLDTKAAAATAATAASVTTPTELKKTTKGKARTAAGVKGEPHVLRPAVERGGSKVAKAAVTGSVKEMPPTKRAYYGQDRKKPIIVKKEGTVTIKKPAPAQRVKVARKIETSLGGSPNFKKQLDAHGVPELIDIRKFPVKIVCKCGQVRWTDSRNALHPIHPVHQCKPCARRRANAARNGAPSHRNDARRKRTSMLREDAVKHGKLTKSKDMGREKAKPTPMTPPKQSIRVPLRGVGSTQKVKR